MRYLEEVYAHARRLDMVFWTGDQILDWYKSRRRR
jgi:hypothetical protein